MATQTSWMQRARVQNVAPVQKAATPRENVSFTSLRTGQYPKHPKPMKAPGQERPPNFGDNGDLEETMWWNTARAQQQRAPQFTDSGSPSYGWDPLGDAAAQMGGGIQDWQPLGPSEPEQPQLSFANLPGEAPQPPDSEVAPPAQVKDISTGVTARNEEAANSPYPPIPGLNPTHPGPNGKPVPTTTQSLSDEYGGYPEKTQPKWWQRAIAGAAGAMAGTANAGHIKHPIDIAAMNQEVLHPGYADKFADWQSKVIPQQMQIGLQAQVRQAQLAQQKAQAQNEQYRQTAAYRAAQALNQAAMAGARNVTVDDNMVAATNGKLTKGSVVPVAVVDSAMKAASTENKPVSVRPGGALVNPKTGSPVYTAPAAAGKENPNEWIAAAAAGDPVAIAKLDQYKRVHAKAPNPVAQEMATQRLEEGRNKANDTIDQRKVVDELAAQRQYKSMIDLSNLSPEQKATAQGAYVAQLQNIQDNYARSIRNRGGTAQDLQVVATPTGVQYVQRTAGSSQRITPPSAVPTATNANGEKIEFRNGKWSPVTNTVK